MLKASRPCLRCGKACANQICDKCKDKTPATRDNANERGYDYEWQQFRIVYLSDNPLCVDCLANAMCYPATEIHHKQKLRDRPELKYTRDNLMGLCKGCHSIRTANGE